LIRFASDAHADWIETDRNRRPIADGVSIDAEYLQPMRGGVRCQRRVAIGRQVDRVRMRSFKEVEFFPHPELVPEESWFSAYVRVDDLDELYADWRAVILPKHGIPRLAPPESIANDLRMFALVDCNGSLLRCLSSSSGLPTSSKARWEVTRSASRYNVAPASARLAI